MIHAASRHGLEGTLAAQIAELRRPAVSSEQIEIIDAGELASRLKLPKSWIQEASRSRTTDPLPHLRFGKYVRFRWGSPELSAWIARRANGQKARVTP